jgi:hypothetical protein
MGYQRDTMSQRDGDIRSMERKVNKNRSPGWVTTTCRSREGTMGMFQLGLVHRGGLWLVWVVSSGLEEIWQIQDRCMALNLQIR